jgi:hypothetical protein
MKYLLSVALLAISIQVCCLPRQLVVDYKRQAYQQVAQLEIQFTILDPVTKTTRNPTLTATGFAIDSRYIATARTLLCHSVQSCFDVF